MTTIVGSLTGLPYCAQAPFCPSYTSLDAQVQFVCSLIISLLLYMRRLGPLVRFWTMRYEAKHAYFKSLVQSIENFINLPYTLAMRHQHYLCYHHVTTSEAERTQLNVGPGRLY